MRIHESKMLSSNYEEQWENATQISLTWMQTHWKEYIQNLTTRTHENSLFLSRIQKWSWRHMIMLIEKIHYSIINCMLKSNFVLIVSQNCIKTRNFWILFDENCCWRLWKSNYVQIEIERVNHLNRIWHVLTFVRFFTVCDINLKFSCLLNECVERSRCWKVWINNFDSISHIFALSILYVTYKFVHKISICVNVKTINWSISCLCWNVLNIVWLSIFLYAWEVILMINLIALYSIK